MTERFSVAISVACVGHGGSLITEVRRVLFDVRIRQCQSSFQPVSSLSRDPCRGSILLSILGLLEPP